GRPPHGDPVATSARFQRAKNRLVDPISTLRLLRFQNYRNPHGAAIDQVKNRLRPLGLPGNLHPTVLHAAEAGGLESPSTFVRLAESHGWWRLRQAEDRCTMLGYGGADDVQHVVFLCPLREDIAPAWSQHAKGFGDRPIGVAEVHDTEGANDMIERT